MYCFSCLILPVGTIITRVVYFYSTVCLSAVVFSKYFIVQESAITDIAILLLSKKNSTITGTAIYTSVQYSTSVHITIVLYISWVRNLIIKAIYSLFILLLLLLYSHGISERLGTALDTETSCLDNKRKYWVAILILLTVDRFCSKIQENVYPGYLNVNKYLYLLVYCFCLVPRCK